MNSTPMAKRSKRAQREHYAAKRGSWNGLSPGHPGRAEQKDLRPKPRETRNPPRK